MFDDCVLDVCGSFPKESNDFRIRSTTATSLSEMQYVLGTMKTCSGSAELHRSFGLKFALHLYVFLAHFSPVVLLQILFRRSHAFFAAGAWWKLHQATVVTSRPTFQALASCFGAY